VQDAAEVLGVSELPSHPQLRGRRFAGLKRGRSWAMTEPQSLDAIEVMSRKARPSRSAVAVGIDAYE
jgi:hypothetical protein